MSKCTEESFLKDVSEHKMEILRDDGVYRHVRFAEPGTNCYAFNLITGPGFLLYRGDMGCYEFERLYDMFDFFRKGKNSIYPGIYSNPGYWEEKCQSESRFCGGIKEFSHDSFSETVLSTAKEFADEHELSDDALDDFNRQIKSLILSVDSEAAAYEVMRSWDFDSIDIDDEYSNFTATDVFGEDSWEYDFKEYTYHFIWCCYAIAWGIMQYDKAIKEPSDTEKLRAFSQEVMSAWPGGSLDGDQLQEAGVKHGLLEPVIRHESCVDGGPFCQCAEYYNEDDFKAGIECLRKTKLLTGDSE
jgi:hypothetical protein